MGIRVLIAGGGTSGHIHPAIAIADRIRAEYPDSIIEFCGTSRGMENDIVRRAGYVMHVIRASGMPIKPSIKTIKALLDFRAGRKLCISLIRTFLPDVIVGTGGYVCSPLVSAAYHERIPVLLHEQNAFPGRSNRLMSRKAAVVCTSFPGMEKCFPKAKKIVLTGNPVRSVFFDAARDPARKALHIEEDVFLILAMGGSLGARTINQSVVSMAEMDFGRKVKIVLSTGKQHFSLYSGKNDEVNDRIEVIEYVYNPHLYMAAADLVICRSGAITCAEVAAIGVASVMIPYPFAAGDHQTYNARAFLDRGACVLMHDKDTSPAALFDAVKPLLHDPEQLKFMRLQAKDLARPSADKDIVEQILRLAGR